MHAPHKRYWISKLLVLHYGMQRTNQFQEICFCDDCTRMEYYFPFLSMQHKFCSHEMFRLSHYKINTHAHYKTTYLLIPFFKAGKETKQEIAARLWRWQPKVEHGLCCQLRNLSLCGMDGNQWGATSFSQYWAGIVGRCCANIGNKLPY